MWQEVLSVPVVRSQWTYFKDWLWMRDTRKEKAKEGKNGFPPFLGVDWWAEYRIFNGKNVTINLRNINIYLNFCLINQEPGTFRHHKPHAIDSHLPDDYFCQVLFSHTCTLMIFICCEAPDWELAAPRPVNSCWRCRLLADSHCVSFLGDFFV